MAASQALHQPSPTTDTATCAVSSSFPMFCSSTPLPEKLCLCRRHWSRVTSPAETLLRLVAPSHCEACWAPFRQEELILFDVNFFWQANPSGGT